MLRLIPHVTEKTLPLSQHHIYTFITDGLWTADAIRAQLSTRFNLHPISIRIARRHSKRRYLGGRQIIKRSVATVAYVRLPKGESLSAFSPPKGKDHGQN